MFSLNVENKSLFNVQFLCTHLYRLSGNEVRRSKDLELKTGKLSSCATPSYHLKTGIRVGRNRNLFHQNINVSVVEDKKNNENLGIINNNLHLSYFDTLSRSRKTKAPFKTTHSKLSALPPSFKNARPRTDNHPSNGSDFGNHVKPFKRSLKLSPHEGDLEATYF